VSKLSIRYFLSCATLGVTLSLAGTGDAADTHVVVAQKNLTWIYSGQASTPQKPIMVDDLKIGDIVEIQVPVPSGKHGFITIKKTTGAATEIKDPVLACGEAAASKPNAVLKEIECGAATKFGVVYTGSLKLEVLPTFKDSVDFYCWVHKAAMPGTLKLKPTT
jgi:hypothetical protein